MKNLRQFLSIAFMLFSMNLSGQMYWQLTTNDEPTYKAREQQHRSLMNYDNAEETEFVGFGLHVNSYYLGGGTTVLFADNPAFDNQFSVNADLVANLIPAINIGSFKLNLPFRGNIQALIFGNDPDAEFQAGIYPFGQIKENSASLDIILHGLFEGRINPVEAGFEESTRSYNGGLGLDLALYIKENSKPISLGFAFLFQRQTRAVDMSIIKENAFGVEATGIFQVAPGFGVMGQYYRNFSGFRDTGFRTGIIMIGANKGN